MGKKRKHEQNGKTSMPSDQMPLEESSDISPSSFCDVLIQFKDIIQVKVNTDEKLQELGEKVKQIKNKSKKDLSVLKEALKKELIDEIKKLKKELIAEVREDLKKELIDELKKELIADVREDLKKELIDEIKKLKKELIAEVREDLKKELIEEIKKLKKELIAEVREDLKKELIDEVKEELKLEIQQEMQKVESKSKEDFSVFKEDLKKELKEVMEEPDLDIQEEMQKEGCAKVHHYNASPSLRSQPNQSQTPRFRLAIKSTVSNLVYKGKPIRTDDCEGHIEVVLYDGGNPIAPDHHLASAAVQLVVVDGEFNERTQGFWSKDDFEKSIIKPRQGNPRLVKDGRFILAGGRYRHKGAVITDNSNRKDVKLGVMIVGDWEERVLEGVSNPFRVQEAKTEINRVKSRESATDDTAEDLPRYTGQNFSYVTKKNGQGQQYSLPTTGQMYNFPNMQNPSHTAYAQTAGNGQVGPLLVDCLQQQYTTQQGATQLENHGQGWQHSFPPTGQMRNFPIMQNPSQRTYAQIAGNGPDGHHLQQQYTTQHGTTQLEKNGICSRRQGQQHSAPPTGQMCNFPIMQNPSQRTYAQTAGNGPDGQLPVDHLTQQVDHLTQQHTPQRGTIPLENHGQGRQRSLLPTGQVCNFPIMQNPSQRTYETAAQGWQHSVQPTGQVCNFPITQNPSQRIYAQTAGNGLDSQLPVDHLQQRYTTHHGTTQLENHGSDLVCDLAVLTSSSSVLNNWDEGSASTTHINPPQHQFSQDQHMAVSESRGQNSGLGDSNHFHDRQKVYEELFGEVGCGPQD